MADEKKVQLTEERTDDADAPKDTHMAARPAISMQEQQDKLRDGVIMGFVCNEDGYEQVSPMIRCPKCGSKDIATREFSSTGKVVSYTIQSVASEQFMNEVPFAFAIVDLDDGPKVSGWIPYISKADELPLGTKVEYTPSYKPGMMFEKSS